MAVANISTHGTTAHDHHDDHHEHSDNFITKYIFSTDHKMIGKQFFGYRYCMGTYWWFPIHSF